MGVKPAAMVKMAMTTAKAMIARMAPFRSAGFRMPVRRPVKLPLGKLSLRVTTEVVVAADIPIGMRVRDRRRGRAVDEKRHQQKPGQNGRGPIAMHFRSDKQIFERVFKQIRPAAKAPSGRYVAFQV